MFFSKTRHVTKRKCQMTVKEVSKIVKKDETEYLCAGYHWDRLRASINLKKK